MENLCTMMEIDSPIYAPLPPPVILDMIVEYAGPKCWNITRLICKEFNVATKKAAKLFVETADREYLFDEHIILWHNISPTCDEIIDAECEDELPLLRTMIRRWCRDNPFIDIPPIDDTVIESFMFRRPTQGKNTSAAMAGRRLLNHFREYGDDVLLVVVDEFIRSLTATDMWRENPLLGSPELAYMFLLKPQEKYPPADKRTWKIILSKWCSAIRFISPQIIVDSAVSVLRNYPVIEGSQLTIECGLGNEYNRERLFEYLEEPVVNDYADDNESVDTYELVIIILCAIGFGAYDNRPAVGDKMLQFENRIRYRASREFVGRFIDRCKQLPADVYPRPIFAAVAKRSEQH